MRLRVAEDLTLPAEAVTETFGILAVRGAGKSNTAAVMAEEMFAAKLPFVVVDPVHAWWGLRSDADGKSAGLPVPIFGGKRGDVPLERTGGNLIADLIVDQRLSCVLDISGFDSESARKAFLLDFARRLYQRNEHPLHLFLEEADDYIPQRPMRDELLLLRAWENIVRRGRGRGLGMTLITQRSAAINKNVLTQIGTLIAMRTTGPQDRGAIEEWLKYNDQGREILASLPSLDDGEAWVWSPRFLHKTVRVRFRRRATFDSGATPKASATPRNPATLADVDLGDITKKMAATIEKAKADDPRELRAEIARLKADIAKRQHVPVGGQIKEKRVEVPVLKDAQLSRLIKHYERMLAEAEKHGAAMSLLWKHQSEEAAALLNVLRSVAAPRPPVVHPSVRSTSGVVTTLRPRAGRSPHHAPAEGLTRPQQQILDTVAMLDVRGLPPDRERVARWLGLHPNTGSYGQNLARLRADGYMEGFALTPKGSAAARAQDTGLDAALAALDGEPKRNIIRVLLDAGHPLSREEVAEALGLHPNTGSYGQNLAWLRTMGLITERGPIATTEGLKR